MKLEKYFKKFDSEIGLNPTRKQRIESAYETWKENFKDHDDLKYIFEDFYQQGSYATNTAIKPQNSSEFDIDAVILLNLADDKQPKETLQLIKNIIESYSTYKGKVKIKDRCVRIDYAGEFHMDIVPAKTSNDEYILIPCKTDDEWQETNPKGFKNWFNDKHAEASYKLSIIVRIVKYWRDIKVGKNTAPKSILLSTLLANSIIPSNSIAETLVLTLENLIENIDLILDSDGQPYVENPSLTGENLARDWSKDKFDIFKAKLEKFAVDARTALNEESKSESIKQWRNIFDTKFPKELPEEKLANDISTGKVLVNSSGTLNTTQGKVIPNHRFYGEVIYEKK
ncbi:SMODS domain-containing nucleotidyltransferase [Clostridium perfringens]